MASGSFSEEDLLCPVCCDIFKNPVLLSCTHSVCENCVRRFWENKQTPKMCPVCRGLSSYECPPLNLALKNLCETYQQGRSQRSSSGDENVCSAHKEKLKLFCLDDQEPVCLVCRDSRKHTNHRFCPIDEAVMDNKEKFKTSLKPLQEKLRTFENFKHHLDHTAEHIKIKAQQTERQIKAEFKELHQLLRDEETARITALREEEKQKIQMTMEKIEETSKQISSLSHLIADIEEQMKAEDVSFLQNFKRMLKRAQQRQPNPEDISMMISVPKYLSNLKLAVLRKLQDIIAKTSYVKYEPSDSQCNDLRFGAMAISVDSVKFNGNVCVAHSGGKHSKIFRSKEGQRNFLLAADQHTGCPLGAAEGVAVTSQTIIHKRSLKYLQPQ